ncbi:green-sensitive opsin-3 [Eurytemora carolleeae]|uniref:green-sensitive opsin-3 n=1 Tax=Eurytemora carolleeae TaxID=1294199 RepID=UPI000C79107D|nr:green-sensitive opsin-3 [Eurytemora carolleeae]|eukprot:XP_023330884.1 green-sensitive opsin-3-like [Eurytemora affinis]
MSSSHEVNHTIDIYTVYPDLPDWVFDVFATYLFILGTITLPLNGFFLYLFYKTPKLRTDFNLLLFNLVVAETGIGIFGIITDFVATARHGWDMGKDFCIFTGFALTLFGMASVNNLLNIALFRWAVYIFEARHISASQLARGLVWLNWCWSLMFAVPPLVGWGQYLPEVNGMSCAPAWRASEGTLDYFNIISYNIFLIGLGFFIPVIIIFSTSLNLYMKLNKDVRSIVCDSVRAAACKESFLETLYLNFDYQFSNKII